MNKNFPPKSRLAAMLIVRDNEETIARTINSILPFISQLVIVDTGSIDSTPSICKNFGAELHFHKWEDSFAEARNYGLKFTRRDWVLSIDSDEVLDGESLQNNYKLFDSDAGGLSVKLINYLGEDISSGQTEHKYTRIFRRHPEIRYTGKIHEQIADSVLSAGFEIIDTDIVIEHYGYINTADSKIIRNKELLKKELESNPNDYWLMFHLAETEFSDKAFQEAEILFQTLINKNEIPVNHMEKSRIRLAQIALGNDNYHLVERFTAFTSDDLNIEGFRKYVLAASYLMQKKFDSAWHLYTSNEVIQSGMVPKGELENAVNLLNKIRK